MDRPEDGIAGDLRSADPGRRLGALERLLASASAVPAALVDALAACVGDPSKAVQRRAADALARIADRGVVRAALTPMLRDADARRRWGAAYALGVAVGPEASLLPIFLEVLGDDDGDRRWAAAELVSALGRRDETIGAALLGLAGSTNPRQRKMALYCLRDLGRQGDAAEAAARGGLGDADAAVRLAALSLAKRCARPEALVDAVVGVLDRDPDAGVRRAAAATLGSWRHLAVAAGALERVAQSGDASLRRAAAQALQCREGPPR